MRKATIAFESTPLATDSFHGYEGAFTVGSGAGVSREVDVFATGIYSRMCDSGASNALAYNQLQWGLLGQFGYWITVQCMVDALPDSTVKFTTLADNSRQLAGARLTSAGKLQLWKETTGSEVQLGSDSSYTVQANVPFWIDLFCKTVAGASDEAQLWVDDVQVASATGQTLGDSHVTNVFFGWLQAPGASKKIRFANMKINDDQGASHTGRASHRKVRYLYPISDNAVTGSWTAGAGGTSNLYDAVNTNTPVPGVASGSATNTSQIKNTNTSDVTGNFDANMGAYSTINSIGTVALVQAAVLVGSHDTSFIDGALKIVSNPTQSGEDARLMGRGSAIGTFGSGWNAIWGTAQDNPSIVQGTSPVMRLGRRGTQTGHLHGTGMIMAVEYDDPTQETTFVIPHRVGY